MAGIDPRNRPLGVEAARRVLIEVWTLLAEHRDSLTLVGGSVPPLIVGEVADDPYVGTLDVDLVIDPLAVPRDAYATIAELLRARGYYNEDGQPFRWFRDVTIEGQSIRVELDLLAPVTDRTGVSHRHEIIEGQKLARRTRGTELLRTATSEHTVAGTLPDGRQDSVSVRVALPGALIVLKALALSGRSKDKDAYDIDYLLRHVPGGIEGIAEEIAQFGDVEPVRDALVALREKFATQESFGPQTVATYRGLKLGSEEADQAQAVAYARVRALLLALDDLDGRGG